MIERVVDPVCVQIISQLKVVGCKSQSTPRIYAEISRLIENDREAIARVTVTGPRGF